MEDDEDVNNYYGGQKIQRGGRKKRKKNKDAPQAMQQDWDDIYDPTRPNNYEEYKNSEEKIREVREWKDLLYRHRMNRDRSSDHRTDSEDDREVSADSKSTSSYSLRCTDIARTSLPSTHVFCAASQPKRRPTTATAAV